MGELLDKFGNKSAGQLIKSQDWNGLIKGIEDLGEDLTKQINDLKTSLSARLDGLDGQVAQLRTDVDALKNQVEGIEKLHRLTVSTARPRFAVGELAEIDVTVTDLRGTAITSRPWVDFVTPWGFLRPAPGFNSVGGEGDRSMSVQTDANGNARVLLRAEHSEHLTPQTENDVAATLKTKISTNKMLSEAIVEAATPMEAKTSGVFPTLTTEYDRVDSTSVRSYVDTYYLKNTSMGVSRIGQSILPGWRDYQSLWSDYHTVVMAFVRSEDNQQGGSGSAAISITFRDWIYHWINLDYLPTLENRLPDILSRLTPKVTGNYAASVQAIRDEVNTLVSDKGLLGKFREYEAVHQALDTLNPANAPAFLNDLTTSMKNAVRVQQTLETVQISSGHASGQAVAFQAFSDTASRAQPSTVNVGALQQRLDQVEKQTGALTDQVNTHDQNIKTVGNRLDVALSEGGEIARLHKSVETVSQQVNAFQGLNVTDTKERLLKVDDLTNRIRQLEARP